MLAMNRLSRVGLVSVAALGLSAASQAIVFSNINMTFTPVGLGAGSSTVISASDIDFFTPNFQVGDFMFGPARVGVLTLTYEATDVNAMNCMIFTLLGSVGGSGQIQVSEVIEDMNTPGIIGSLPNTVINNNSQLPASWNINFTRGSTHIKVKKDILISAEPDTNALDFARVGLIEQTIKTVPEPATIAAIGMGLAALMGRRRKN